MPKLHCFARNIAVSLLHSFVAFLNQAIIRKYVRTCKNLACTSTRISKDLACAGTLLVERAEVLAFAKDFACARIQHL